MIAPTVAPTTAAPVTNPPETAPPATTPVTEPAAPETTAAATSVPETTVLQDISFFNGKGCEKCQQTGYLGRVGVYEMVPIDQSMAHSLVNDASVEAVRKIGEQSGSLSLSEDGILKVFQGVTTFDEVLRVTRE